MITLNMMLLPYGSGIGRSPIISGHIWTTDDGKHHAYELEINDVRHSGQVEKTMSGHRNPLQLLQRIAEDILNDGDNREGQD